MSSEDLQAMYRGSTEIVRANAGDEAWARAQYDRYVSFVKRVAPPGDLLDVGCGNGWSSFVFSREGYRTTGVDLNASAFVPSPSATLRFEEGSAMHLPFAAESFDVVTGHAFLEHTPDPAQVLRDMVRVTRPGGVLCIVGPNLLSIAHSARTLGYFVWRNRPASRILFRDPDMPRHPFGNTLPDALAALLRNQMLLARKLTASEATFTMREPDLTPPFHADSDACYLCNPVDLAKFLPTLDCDVIQNGHPERPGFTRLAAAGTWIAARKRRRE